MRTNSLEAELGEEPAVGALGVALLEGLLDGLLGVLTLGRLLEGVGGDRALEALKLENVTGGEEVRIVDDLDERLDLGALGNLLLAHRLGDLEGVTGGSASITPRQLSCTRLHGILLTAQCQRRWRGGRGAPWCPRHAAEGQRPSCRPVVQRERRRPLRLLAFKLLHQKAGAGLLQGMIRPDEADVSGNLQLRPVLQRLIHTSGLVDLDHCWQESFVSADARVGESRERVRIREVKRVRDSSTSKSITTKNERQHTPNDPDFQQRHRFQRQRPRSDPTTSSSSLSQPTSNFRPPLPFHPVLPLPPLGSSVPSRPSSFHPVGRGPGVVSVVVGAHAGGRCYSLFLVVELLKVRFSETQTTNW